MASFYKFLYFHLNLPLIVCQYIFIVLLIAGILSVVYLIDMSRYHTLLYRSRAHVLATLGIVLMPFLFFLAFGWWSHLSIGGLLSDLGVSLVRLTIAFAFAAIIGWI